MGIFSRLLGLDAAAAHADAADVLAADAAARTIVRPPAPSLSIASPWAPQDALLQWAIDDALGGLDTKREMPVTRDVALRVPGVKRAHGIIARTVASIPLYQMEGDQRTEDQPDWLTNSRFGVSPYHRLYGVASDFFFHGWSLLAFTEDRSDCLHVPYGLWEMGDDGVVSIDHGKFDTIPREYHAHPVAIPLGFGENGLLVDGADTLRQARAIEASYQGRLDNPVPLTVLTLAGERWDGWSPEERADFRNRWVEGRRAANGATAMKPDWVTVDMPGQVPVDLYETGRNGVRIDIANHVGLPVSMIEGVRQGGGGGGTEMRYSGVANGAQRNELWDYGSPRGYLSALESRLSLDDVVGEGLSIRGDLSSALDVPAPLTNPTSED